MSSFEDQVTTARAKAQWDIWKDNIIQQELNLSKCHAQLYSYSGTALKKKEIEFASALLALYSLLRSKLLGNIRFDEKKKFIHLLKLDELNPKEELDIPKLKKDMLDLFHMIDALGYTKVEEVQHFALTPDDF